MAILDLTKVTKNLSQNTNRNSNLNLNYGIGDVKFSPLDFSTNRTTDSYSDQRQNFWNNQQSANTTNIFAIGSSGVSADTRLTPSMETIASPKNSAGTGGGLDFNPNTLLVAAAVVAALWVAAPVVKDLGKEYLGKQPNMNVKGVNA